MDRSRISPRTVALALLCVAVIAFAAATLDSTTTPDDGLGLGSPGEGDQLGGDRTGEADDPGSSDEGSSILDLNMEAGSPLQLCEQWLLQPHVQLLLLGSLLVVFLVGRWIDDAATGLAGVFLVGYPGFFAYLLLTSCNDQQGELLDLSDAGVASQEGGGLFGGVTSVASPTLTTQVLLVVVAGTLLAVAALVLTGDHDQTETVETGGDEAEPEPETNVAAVGAAAGRAADRIERADEFENEVYRAWSEMTEHLAVERPQSSTPAEFAAAATAAGMDGADVDRLTELFESVRYGGAEPTADREDAAVETLRRIESAYAGDDE